jgi:hypothetical protein
MKYKTLVIKELAWLFFDLLDAGWIKIKLIKTTGWFDAAKRLEKKHQFQKASKSLPIKLLVE